MADRPILFSGPMVRAILAGAKWETRQAIRYPDGWRLANPSVGQHGATIGCYHTAAPYFYAERDITSRWAPGDRLWVRETWKLAADREPSDGPCGVWYRADETDESREWGIDLTRDEPVALAQTWRPSIYMPRWASRISLRVTSVRAEQLGEISEADAIAEGVRHAAPVLGHLDVKDSERLSARALFAELWDHVHGDGAWERDRERWVWVVTFGAASGLISEPEAPPAVAVDATRPR